MWIAFIVVWVLIGLGVFFVALRGGPAGARATLHSQSQRARSLATLAFLVVAGFGIAVPALVLAFNGEHKAMVAPGGLTLTGQEVHGRELFSRTCAQCHTLKGAGAFGRVGPNLDIERPPAALVLDAITFGRARGLGQMPAGLYQGADAQAVANFVAAVAGH